MTGPKCKQYGTPLRRLIYNETEVERAHGDLAILVPVPPSMLENPIKT